MVEVSRILSNSQKCAKQNSFNGMNRNIIRKLSERDRRNFGATRRGVEGSGIAIRVRAACYARLGSAPGKTRQRGRARKERCAKIYCQPFCAFRICRSRSLQNLPRRHLQLLGKEPALEDYAGHQRRAVASRMRELPRARIGARGRRWGCNQDLCV